MSKKLVLLENKFNKNFFNPKKLGKREKLSNGNASTAYISYVLMCTYNILYNSFAVFLLYLFSSFLVLCTARNLILCVHIYDIKNLCEYFSNKKNDVMLHIATLLYSTKTTYEKVIIISTKFIKLTKQL